jgi:predicted ribosome quality control (RQC) complex YloA/Tae2 family protein
MENLALVGLIENLRPLMAETIIRRIIQQQPNGFIFQTRSVKLPAFKILSETRNPALYASEVRPPIEPPATDFLMVLRKHLTSAEIVNFHKPLSERILEFSFKTVVPSKELETMFLVVELLPNAPNLILLDAERRVMASFLQMTPQHGIGEYEPYTYPKAGNKIDLERILHEEVPELTAFNTAADPKAWLVSTIAGIGPVFAAELVLRQKKSGRPIVDEIRAMIEHVRTTSRGAWLYTDLPLGHILETNDVQRLSKAILSPIALESVDRTHSSRMFGSIQEGARFYFDEIESRGLLEQAKSPVLKELRSASKRFTDREKKLQREQQKYEEAAGLDKVAQLLTSSGKPMEEHYDSLTVTDYFADKPKPLKVTLDSALSLRENIDRMFKRHSKAGRGRQLVAQQIAELHDRRERLEMQTRRLQAIKDWDTWLAIASRLEKEKSAASGTQPGVEREAVRRRYRRAEIEGREVLVGRNGRENDEVTFQLAQPDDFWLHVADYSGSHVVVRNPMRDRELDPAVLTKAAQIAAFFSQARNSSKVEVHYTRRKYVMKPKRAKPGMVRLAEFKSITVEPKNWLE